MAAQRRSAPLLSTNPPATPTAPVTTDRPIRDRARLRGRLSLALRLASAVDASPSRLDPLPGFFRRCWLLAPAALRISPGLTSGERLDVPADPLGAIGVLARTVDCLPLEPFRPLVSCLSGVLAECRLRVVFAPRRLAVPPECFALLAPARAASAGTAARPVAVPLTRLDARSVRSTSPSSETGRSGTMPPAWSSLRGRWPCAGV